MKVFQVTKYNPKFYGPSGYQKDDWLDYSDVGYRTNSVLLTFDKYLRYETAYANAVLSFVKFLGPAAELTRLGEYRDEIESEQDIMGIADPHRSFTSMKIESDAAIRDFVRLYLRAFIGADLVIPGQGFIDFELDFYMFFGFRNDIRPPWGEICQNLLFERDRTPDLFKTDNFDTCVVKEGLTKNS